MGLFRNGRVLHGAFVALACMAGALGFGLSPGRIDAPLFPLVVALLAAALGVAISKIPGGGSPRHGEAGRGADTSPGQLALPAHVIIPLVSLPLFFLVPLRSHGGALALAAIVVLAKLGDVAGYYVGNAFGKRHPFQNLSPGKTVEGCLGSLVAGTIAGAVFSKLGWLLEPRFGLFSGLLLGALVNLSAQAGDLLESSLKRRAGVKDSGVTFGPSGGMLDLVDSFLLAAPLAATIGPYLFHWS